MHEIDKKVRGDIYDQLEALRRDMEDGLANITENNLKLSQPYVAARSNSMELALLETNGTITLQVFRNGTLYGSVALS